MAGRVSVPLEEGPGRFGFLALYPKISALEPESALELAAQAARAEGQEGAMPEAWPWSQMTQPYTLKHRLWQACRRARWS